MKRSLFVLLLIVSFLHTSQNWGDNVKGVNYKFDTPKKQIALTFDACGGSKKSNGIDEKLFDFLIDQNISATIFVSSKWINANSEFFLKISKVENFDIQNHGTRHVPLSIDGKSIYGIKGTSSQLEIIEEIMNNKNKIFELTNKNPIFFRSGTAFYDEESIKIAKSLGVKIVGFTIAADAGATLSQTQILDNLKNAKPGAIILGHINHPESACALGFITGIKYLKKQGFEFVKLSEVRAPLQEY